MLFRSVGVAAIRRNGCDRVVAVVAQGEATSLTCRSPRECPRRGQREGLLSQHRMHDHGDVGSQNMRSGQRPRLRVGAIVSTKKYAAVDLRVRVEEADHGTELVAKLPCMAQKLDPLV